MGNGPFGKPAATIREETRANLDATVLTTACAFCPWTHTGPAAQGRARALAHRQADHPDLKPAKRRRSNIRRFRVTEDSWRAEGLENASEVAAMHKRREAAA